MASVNNIWVNWAEAEEYAYNVLEFFEWGEEDYLECLDFAPVIKVTSDFLAYVLSGLHPLPEDLLEELLEQTPEGTGVLTDGKHVLVIQTLGYDMAMRKSRMETRRENLLLEQIKYQKAKNYEYEPIENEVHELLPPARAMIGLTRVEREKKQLLLLGLQEVQKEKKSKILYYFSELNPHHYKAAKKLKKAELFEALIQSVYKGWTKNHEYLLEMLVKEHKIKQELYQLQT